MGVETISAIFYKDGRRPVELPNSPYIYGASRQGEYLEIEDSRLDHPNTIVRVFRPEDKVFWVGDSTQIDKKDLEVVDAIVFERKDVYPPEGQSASDFPEWMQKYMVVEYGQYAIRYDFFWWPLDNIEEEF